MRVDFGVRLDWETLRWLFDVPAHVPLPRQEPGARPNRMAGAWRAAWALILMLVVIGAGTVWFQILNRWMQGESGFDAGIIVAPLVIAWIIVERYLDHRRMLAARDTEPNPPTMAAEGSLLTDDALHHLGIMSKRIPGMAMPIFLACAQPQAITVFLIWLLALVLIATDPALLRFAGPVVLLLGIVPIVDVVRTFNALARTRKRLSEGRCIRCGYALAGLSEVPRWVRCPECAELSPATLTAAST